MFLRESVFAFTFKGFRLESILYLARVSTFIQFMCPFLETDISERQVGVRYEVAELPITLPFQKPAMDKPNPKQGIGKLIVPILS